jgi:AraC-like DNA-binding protein
MSYIPNVLRAVDYMERNLTCPVSVSDVASEAAYSTFHFVRLFKALTGYTPGSYLRRRRLTEAAGELAGGRKRIIEIALDYQFQSQEAFTRAFKDCFGINPGVFRNRGGAHLLGAARRIDELFLIHCEEFESQSLIRDPNYTSSGQDTCWAWFPRMRPIDRTGPMQEQNNRNNYRIVCPTV